MKYLIASDIHGSAFWCRKLLTRYEAEQADGLWLLGDLLYHGPRNDLPEEYSPKKVIAMLNPLKDKMVCVRGNCDAEVDQMVLEFPIMNDIKRLKIPGFLPEQAQCAAQPDGYGEKPAGHGAKPVGYGAKPEKAAVGQIRILLTHGHHVNKDSFWLPETEARFGSIACDFLIYGHFHVPLKTCVQGVWCLNPGSVSIPKEDSVHSYMIFEDGKFFWKDMDGNVYDSLALGEDVLYN